LSSRCPASTALFRILDDLQAGRPRTQIHRPQTTRSPIS